MTELYLENEALDWWSVTMVESWSLFMRGLVFFPVSIMCLLGGTLELERRITHPTTALVTKNFTCSENTELFLWTVSRGEEQRRN